MRKEVLYIQGVPESIEYRKPPPEAEAKGYMYGDKSLILVDPAASDDETALHEVLHRIDQRLNDTELTEQQIKALASGLFTVFRDPRNEWFIAQVTDTETLAE